MRDYMPYDDDARVQQSVEDLGRTRVSCLRCRSRADGEEFRRITARLQPGSLVRIDPNPLNGSSPIAKAGAGMPALGLWTRQGFSIGQRC